MSEIDELDELLPGVLMRKGVVPRRVSRPEADGTIKLDMPIRGGWIATYRIENPADPRIAALTIAPGPRGPQAELSARLLRTLRPGEALREAVAALAQWIEVSQDIVTKEPAAGAGVVAAARGWDTEWARARAGVLSRHDVYMRRLLETSVRYVAALGRGERAPVQSVAAEMGRRLSQVRDDLHAARVAGLVTGARQPGERGGRARGALTDRARAMLAEEAR